MINLLQKKFKNFIRSEISSLRKQSELDFQKQLELQGRIAVWMLQERIDKIKNVQDAEFKVYSQWGDDGIIQYLTRKIDISKKVFIEFGVENYLESNTRFLLKNNNWSGFVMDGSDANINFIKNTSDYWQFDLKCKSSFITAENINELIREEDIQGEIGILSIDIDGNDYWIWKSIHVVRPDIVIVEYNSVFGNERSITVPYNPEFVRSDAHFSFLYAGCSLPALCDLAEEKGYIFVGSNSAGNNAYFVVKEKASGLKPLSAEEGYVISKFRESRNKQSELTYTGGKERLEILRGLPVYNTRTKQNEVI